MKISRNHVRVLLAAALSCWALSVSAENPADGVEVKGKAFRAQIVAAFKAEPQFHRFMDVINVCNQAGFEGKTADEVNRILRAAGQTDDLLKGGGSTAQPDDLVGGFGLVSGLTYGSSLTIVLRAPFPAENGKRRIANVRECIIVSSNL